MEVFVQSTRISADRATLDQSSDLVVLEVDQANRFFRLFVAFGVAVHSQQFCIPIVGFDGTHSRHSKYNGVILTLIGRDGDGHNLTLATAFVHVENEANITWFFLRCIDAEITVDGLAVMCDRGKVQGAVKRVWTIRGISIQIRFCTIHILHNINKKFGLSGLAFENTIWKVQAAETASDYAAALNALRSKYGVEKLDSDVADYVSAIEPIRWTVPANMPHAPTIPGTATEPPLSPCCLFGWRSTNFVESDNNTLLSNRVRDGAPYEAINNIAKTTLEKFSTRHVSLRKWKDLSVQVTPHACLLWKIEQEKAGQYVAVRSSDLVWCVVRQGYQKYRRVELEILRCSCSTFVQLRIACRHLVAVIHTANYSGSVLRAFHAAYLVDTFAADFAQASIELAVDHHTSPVTIQPPPYYRQAGRSQKIRIASAGDSRSGATYKYRLCSQVGHNKTSGRRHSGPVDQVNGDFIGVEVDLGRAPFSPAQSQHTGAAPGISRVPSTVYRTYRRSTSPPCSSELSV